MASANASPATATNARAPRRQPSAAKTCYLIAYNFVSAVLWATVLGRTVLVSYLRTPALVHASAGTFVRWTQTLAFLEILHALFGIVRSPVFTTSIQVYSRLLLVWLVVYPFPSVAGNPWYASMLLAWSVTEVIRYSYFALSLGPTGAPGFLTWLRYSTFLVLYPIGITSEVVLMIKATTGPGPELHPLVPWFYIANMVGYVPSSVMLYRLMLSQRRKILRGKQVAGADKTQ